MHVQGRGDEVPAHARDSALREHLIKIWISATVYACGWRPPSGSSRILKDEREILTRETRDAACPSILFAVSHRELNIHYHSLSGVSHLLSCMIVYKGCLCCVPNSLKIRTLSFHMQFLVDFSVVLGVFLMEVCCEPDYERHESQVAHGDGVQYEPS
jgi:hypothetical protein